MLKRCSFVALSACLTLLSLQIAACGGGSANSTGTQPPPPPPPPATITSVSVTPPTPSVQSGGTQQFMATVTGTGTFSPAVTWAVNGTSGGTSVIGTIDASGLYAAPAVVPTPNTLTVSATSVADPTKSGHAQATITAAASPAPTISSISPAQGAPGDEIQISGSNLGYVTQTVVFSGPNGLGIPVLVELGSPTSLTVRVPLQTESGPLFVQVPQTSGNPLNSNTLSFARLPDLRIRASQNDLGAGESESFHVVVFGTSTPQTIVWSANQGSITSGGTYTAPGSLQTDAFTQVTACIQGTQTCDDVLLGLHPFRVGPTSPVVALGNSLQLEPLIAGTPVSATWAQATGDGTLSTAGLYTAGSSPSDGGATLVAATSQGTQESASLGVTGGFPGLVNRVYDYIDLTTVKIQRVTLPLSVAVSSNRAYVLSAQDDTAGVLDRKFFYIDVYDLTDPVHPIWVTAIEAAAAGQLHVAGNTLYDINVNGINGPLPAAMAAYDISGASPVLVDRRPLPDLISWSFYGGVLTGCEASATPAGSPALVDQFSLQGTALMEQQISLPPAISGLPYTVDAVAATPTRIFVTEQSSSTTSGPLLAADYEITTNPPSLLGVASLPVTTYPSGGAINTSSYLYTAQVLLDITQDPPSVVGSLPEPVYEMFDANANSFLLLNYRNGLNVINANGPAASYEAQDLFDFPAEISGGALFGNYVFSAEVHGGLAIYDASVRGGLHFSNQMIANDAGVSLLPVAQVSNGTTLAAAGCGASFCGAYVYGLGASPVLQATISTGATPNALALVANSLFVGTAQSLLVFDLSQPTAPNQIGSINTPVSALAMSGNFLYAGSASNQLLAYNIATPASPTLVASVSLPDLPSQVTVSGTLLLVADVTGGFMVFDISTPANPVLLSQLKISPAVLGVQAGGNLAFLAALETGLVIVDLTSPTSPQIVSQTGLDSIDPFAPGLALLQNRAAVIAVQGQIVYVGVDNFDTSDVPNNGNGMVYGFDYSQPQHPRLVSLGAYASEVDGFISSLCVVGNDVYVGGFAVPLVEYDASQPRNSINLYYPPTALRLPPLLPPPVP